MNVTNSTSYQLIAVGWHRDRGYGTEVSIDPRETKQVLGPYVGDLEGEPCHVLIPGNVTCHEVPDDRNGFMVAPGKQLVLQESEGKKTGITIRHHADPLEEVTKEESHV